MTTAAIDARTAYIDGLREIANALEADPALSSPPESLYPGAGQISFLVSSREAMAAWACLLEGATEGTANSIHHVQGHIRGVPVRVFASTEKIGGSKKTIVTREVETFEVEPFLPVQP